MNWINYSSLFLEDFSRDDVDPNVLALLKDDRLAAVISFHYGRINEDWFNVQIPALGGKTPLECLGSEDGLVKLKEMLMKVPC